MLSPKPYFQDNQIYVGLFPHEGDIEAHSHPFYELVFFEYGLINHMWEGRRSILTRGDLFCIRPGEVHLYTQSKNAKLYNCLFYAEAIPQTVEELPGVRELLGGQEQVRFHLPPVAQKQLKGILQQMIGELQEQAPGYNQALSLFLGLLLVFVGRFLESAKVEEGPYAPSGKVQAALRYLEENYAQKIKLEQVAQKHGLSQQQFSRFVRQLVGIPPQEYLQNIRLSQAMELLRTGKLPVREVAKQVGFDDPNYFARLFRRHIGLSPSQFRAEGG